MNGIMIIVQSLEDFNILLKGISKTIENETKEQKGGLLGILLGTLGASTLANMLTGKGTLRAGNRNKEGKLIVRAGYGLRFIYLLIYLFIYFDSVSSFNKLWNTKVLSELTWIWWSLF